VKEDVIVLGLPIALLILDGLMFARVRPVRVAVGVAILIAAAALGYALGSTATLSKAKRGWYAMAILFILPLAIYPVLSPWVAACVVAITFVIAYLGVRRSLADFPWDRPWWTVEPIDKFRQDFRQNCGDLWPYAHTWPEPIEPRRVRRGALAGSALFAWWLHVFLAMSIRTGIGKWAKLQWVVFGLVMVGTFLWRVAVYFGGVRSPLPMRARLRSLRVIVPGYDYAWLASIGAAAAGGVTALVLVCNGYAESAAIPGALLVLLALAIVLPPDPQTWRLTSRRCVIKPDYEADVQMQTELKEMEG
jgi:hypothetical protein